MKISISIPDALFNVAEKLAARIGLSRSELYQRAMSLYIDQHGADNVTESLDALYGRADADSGLDSVLEQLQGATLASSDW